MTLAVEKRFNVISQIIYLILDLNSINSDLILIEHFLWPRHCAALYSFSYLIFQITLKGGCYYYSYFMRGGTKVQDYVIYL